MLEEISIWDSHAVRSACETSMRRVLVRTCEEAASTRGNVAMSVGGAVNICVNFLVSRTKRCDIDGVHSSFAALKV